MKKTIALLLAIVMIVSMFAACSNTADDANNDATDPIVDNDQGGDTADDTDGTEEPDTAVEGTYTYEDSVVTMATNWNPHTYQTQDDAYPSDTGRIAIGHGYFITVGSSHFGTAETV